MTSSAPNDRAATAAPRPHSGETRHAASPNAVRARLAQIQDHQTPWYRWGSYLSDRQWGTVREDYSPHGTAWDYFPHDHARSRAYRWGEDGLLGISDNRGRLCFALALWNEADPILKERLFGLAGPEGNHGEDVKEYYFYLDNTPCHAYMKALYKYPQAAFPYAQLVAENRRRGRDDPEYELRDTGLFAHDRYFDVVVEYAKAAPEDILIRISATNRGPDPAPLHLLPTLWFRNTWSWGDVGETPPSLRGLESDQGDLRLIQADHPSLGTYWLACHQQPDLLFTENETNAHRLWGVPNRTPYVKDAFHTAIIERQPAALNARPVGTKAAAHYVTTIQPGATETFLLRLSNQRSAQPFVGAEGIFATRIAEADAFYAGYGPENMSADERSVQRQAFAGLLWCKQFYAYDVEKWLSGDSAGPPPPPQRQAGRNSGWQHLVNADVISMPDTWEYPWYASWDLAFHCIPLAQIDPEFAKRQLILILREWYMHPNGQIPGYEWSLSDVNPPVHAWAAWRVYKIGGRVTGVYDRVFLERVFQKLLLNFTWWVNRKDSDGHNVFQGGFLGLDNIGVFDRSADLPDGGHIEQADGTAWMGMYCLNMLAIALELARDNPAYEDVATKFFEHFLYIAGALNNISGTGINLWDEEDEFFYDVLHLPNGDARPLKVRSYVGLLPLLAVETIEPEMIDKLPKFRARMEWFLTNRPHLARLVSRWTEPGVGERRLLALAYGHRMNCLLRRMLDPHEFLGDYGIRAISRYHRDHPYTLRLDGLSYTVGYEPAESRSGVFGGNSNWRGPIWFPINYLLIEALQKFHHYHGDDYRVEHPTGSGQLCTLDHIADDLSRRLVGIFLKDEQKNGARPVFGQDTMFQTDPQWRDYLLFYEYFHGDTGEGLGASHQTGWTAVSAKLLEQTSTKRGSAAPRSGVNGQADHPH